MFCSRRGPSVGCDGTDSCRNGHKYLINFLYTGHLWLLGRLPGFRFVILDEVIAEIAQADQQQIIAEAMAAGHVQRESISSPDELALFAELRQVLGLANPPASRLPRSAAGSWHATRRESF